MKLTKTHIRILTTCSIVRFAPEKALYDSYPKNAIDELVEDGILKKSRNNSFYNTKEASRLFRQFLCTYSPRLTTLQMVDVLQNASAYIVLDIETTGGSAIRGDKIVEIAALKIENGELVDMFHRFVNPEIRITNSHIHGITNKRVQKEQTIRPIIKEFKSFIEDLPIVSHHIGFDWYNFLALELFRNGIAPTNKAACTVMLARKYLNSPKNNLNVIAKTYNIPLLKHHTADADAICANAILQLCLQQALQKKTNL